MIVRIVKMEFKPEKVSDFLELFHRTRDQIRNFPGVEKLEFYRDASAENVYYTLSHWRSEGDLEKYRKSELFGEVWGKTRMMFSGKAQAFSMLGE